jgi:hypothetical protein
MCPGRGRPTPSTTGAWTDYFYNLFLNDSSTGTVSTANSKRTLIGIIDCTSNTILVGHGMVSTSSYSTNTAFNGSTDIFQASTATNFGTVRGTTAIVLGRDSAATPTIGSWGGPFSQGAIMCWADGTVRMVPYATTVGTIASGVGTASTFAALLTPKGSDISPVID